MKDLITFLAGVFVISASGALMPGPVMAVTIAKGRESAKEGAWIALGHGAVETPLIIAIALGLSVIFKNPYWKFFVGVIGGAFLVYMGYGLVMERKALGAGEKKVPYGSFKAGLITSASNPFFYIWWAVVGAALITKSLSWGIIGVALLIVVHWSVDLIWYLLLTFTTYHGRKIMSSRVHEGVFAMCGMFLIYLGVKFILDGSGVLDYLVLKLAFLLSSLPV